MKEEILLENLNQIKENINQYSPHPNKVKIIAVTKNFSHHAIMSAVAQNVKCIGENRVQEFFDKKEKLKDIEMEAHLIGHLQSNKINKALKIFNVIQTVDTLKLAKKINEKLKNTNHNKEIFIQLNLAEDKKNMDLKTQTFLKKLSKYKS